MDNIFYKLFDEILLEIHQHEYDITGKDFQKGLTTEESFDRCMEENGYISLDLGKEADLKHIDRLVYKEVDGKKIGPSGKLGGNKVEIKGNKHNANGDLLIEIIGITGYSGWLYTTADYISFVTPELKKMFWVPALKLRILIEKIGGFKLKGFDNNVEIIMKDGHPPDFVDNDNDAVLPVFYSRLAPIAAHRENKDIVTRIPIELLQQLKDKILKFNYK